ncbi:MAG: ABC transporter ATP-binding protein [Oscillospiraceae bacterium]|nr:ABC transporter ATP-binding protein [Oscillospiraceae bacterium]MDD3261758.1 ABC transporter ATP-binding protein [Oscillospiraceae bacterium]
MSGPVIIDVQHLTKRYDAQPGAKGEKEAASSTVLRDVNLQIHKGEFHIFLGKSGCGKSTLLNILAGFLPKSEGSVQINGKEVSGPGPDRGMVFQNADTAIFPWLNVWKNVEYGLRMQKTDRAERAETVRRCLRLVGLTGHEEKYPDELSGGMKQRVQIARSIANNSEILIMDEPFGALDAQTRVMLQQELIHIWQVTQKTILFVTHDIQEALNLGQRISIFSTPPDASIYKTIPINLPYLRDPTDAKWQALSKEILGYFSVSADYAI